MLGKPYLFLLAGLLGGKEGNFTIPEPFINLPLTLIQVGGGVVAEGLGSCRTKGCLKGSSPTRIGIVNILAEGRV